MRLILETLRYIALLSHNELIPDIVLCKHFVTATYCFGSGHTLVVTLGHMFLFSGKTTGLIAHINPRYNIYNKTLEPRICKYCCIHQTTNTNCEVVHPPELLCAQGYYAQHSYPSYMEAKSEGRLSCWPPYSKVLVIHEWGDKVTRGKRCTQYRLKF